MRASNVSTGLLVGTALALVACAPDTTSVLSSSGGDGGDGTSSSTTESAGPGQGGDDETSGKTSSGNSTQSGGGDGAGGPGNGGASSVGSAGGDPGSGGETGTGGSDTSAGTGGEGGEGGSGPPPCSEGVIQCDGTTQRVCDGEGGYTDVLECAPGGCVPGVGCTTCQPNTASCDGNVSSVCNSDGDGYDVYVCDPVQGSTCDAGTGHCIGACAPEAIGSSYIGCDYYPTVTLNTALQLGNFAVAVANTSDEAANVQVDRGASLVTSVSVAANSVQIITLPWVNELKNNNASTQLIADGAYHLRTTQPVTVYQYSPIEYSTPSGFTYTNDASLLLPSNAWTGNYRVVSRNSWHFDAGNLNYPGFYSVIASKDGTTVTLGPSATATAIRAGGGLPANGAGTVILNEGDVLQVVAATSGFNPDPIDLTGTLVTADKPVQVIGGHDCTYIPYNTAACDHLEEAMFPIETLAPTYLVTAPLIPSGVAKAEMVRVVATESLTTVTYDPPQPSAPTILANPGDYFEISQTAADFQITGDKPIYVAQYAMSQQAGGNTGDPAMAMAVATEQYRDEYLFHAPTNYEVNYVNIMAPDGAVIVLDGAQVGGFTPIGSSGYSIARVSLNNAGDGNHYIMGDQEFGISVYGYGQYTSYWYPGGLDLDQVN